MPIRYSTVVIENDKPGDRGQMRNEICKEIKHDLTTIVDKCGPCASIEPKWMQSQEVGGRTQFLSRYMTTSILVHSLKPSKAPPSGNRLVVKMMQWKLCVLISVHSRGDNRWGLLG